MLRFLGGVIKIGVDNWCPTSAGNPAVATLTLYAPDSQIGFDNIG